MDESTVTTPKKTMINRQFSIQITTSNDKTGNDEIIQINVPNDISSKPHENNFTDLKLTGLTDPASLDPSKHAHLELLNALSKERCVERIHALRTMVDRTVEDVSYRDDIAGSPGVIADIALVVKQYWQSSSSIYEKLVSPSSLMDTGRESAGEHKRLFVTRWALVLRLFNLLKNILVSRVVDVQEEIHSHKLLFDLVKLIPKAMMAKTIALREGSNLLQFAEDDLRHALPICIKADSTVVSFCLNCISGSTKYQDMFRTQLFPGAISVLALWLLDSPMNNPRRLAKDASHLVYLLQTIFSTCSSTEFADWFDFETKSNITSNKPKAPFVSRTLTNLTSETLGLPSSSGMSKTNPDGALGCLLEAQESYISGKGARLERSVSFRKLIDRSGSNGLNGRDGLLIMIAFAHVMTSKLREVGDETALRDFSTSWFYFLRNLASRQKHQFVSLMVEGFGVCKVVFRLLKAVFVKSEQTELKPMTRSFENASKSTDALHLMSTEAFRAFKMILGESDSKDTVHEMLMRGQGITVKFTRKCLATCLGTFLVGGANDKSNTVMAPISHGLLSMFFTVSPHLNAFQESNDDGPGKSHCLMSEWLVRSAKADLRMVHNCLSDCTIAGKDDLLRLTDMPHFGAGLTSLMQMSSGAVMKMSLDIITNNSEIVLAAPQDCVFMFYTTLIECVLVSLQIVLASTISLADYAEEASEANKSRFEDPSTVSRCPLRNTLDECEWNSSLGLELLSVLLYSIKSYHSKAGLMQELFAVVKKYEGFSLIASLTGITTHDEPTCKERAHIVLRAFGDCCPDEWTKEIAALRE